MGNAAICNEQGTCQSGVDFLERVSTDDAAAAPPAKASALRCEERRWLPESLFHARLLLGLVPALAADARSDTTPTAEDCWLLLFGADGSVLAVMGHRGLARFRGVQLERHGGREAFALRLAKLGPEVRGVLLMAASTATAAVGMLAASTGKGSDLKPEVASRPAARPLCWLIPRTDATASATKLGQDTALLALHCGLPYSRPWEVEGVGRAVPSAVGGPMVAAGKLTAELAMRAQRFFTSGHETATALPPAPLAEKTADLDVAVGEDQEEPDLETLEHELATTHRFAGERGAALLRERRRTVELRGRLALAQRRLSDTCTDLDEFHCSVEAWRRKALIAAQLGDEEGVVSLLPSFPADGTDATASGGLHKVGVPPPGVCQRVRIGK
mmetsp:Transcript_6667/g.13655  ORF Transcript_6667/g.13655 Transcript_6667/m.13655 type:complete len:387 (-) Transcript_6667:59-1219(-)